MHVKAIAVDMFSQHIMVVFYGVDTCRAEVDNYPENSLHHYIHRMFDCSLGSVLVLHRCTNYDSKYHL